MEMLNKCFFISYFEMNCYWKMIIPKSNKELNWRDVEVCQQTGSNIIHEDMDNDG